VVRSLVALFVGATLVFGKPIVNGDGVQYYAYARSTVIDRDLRFGDEYREALPRFRSLAPPPTVTPRGFDAAYAPVGAAVVWFIPFAAAHGLALTARRVFGSVAVDGYSDFYMFTVSLTSWLAVLAGLLLSFDLCRVFVSRRAAILGVLGAWLATPLFANAYELPTFAHGVDFGLVSLLVWVTVKRAWRSDARDWALLGVAFGWCVATRQQNVTLALMPIGCWIALWRHQRERRRALLGCAAAAGVGAAIGYAPQLAINVSLYGRLFPWHPEYLPSVAWPPHVASVLFSSNNGLFSWTPLSAVAVAGLGAGAFSRRWRRIAWASLTIFFLNVLVVAVLPYGPVLIGQRYLINCTPFYGLGLAFLAEAARVESRWRFALCIGVLIVFAAWNLGLETLVVYGLIDRAGAFSFAELLRKQVFVAPTYLIRHAQGISINQPCFSPLQSLWLGVKGDAGSLLRGTLGIAAVAAGALLTARATDAIICADPERSSVNHLLLPFGLVPVMVVGVWLWLGAPFHVLG
jgi:hypothetical protein